MRFVILILLAGLTAYSGGQTLRVADVIQNGEHLHGNMTSISKEKSDVMFP